MKDVRMFSFLLNIFTEHPWLPTSPLLLQQVLDGLLRLVHHPPDHVRTDLHTSLQIFAARFNLKQTILPMALPNNVAAIVQPPLQLDHGIPSFSNSTSPATDPSDARQITDGWLCGATSSPRPRLLPCSFLHDHRLGGYSENNSEPSIPS
jgi:hypothetical protein